MRTAAPRSVFVSAAMACLACAAVGAAPTAAGAPQERVVYTRGELRSTSSEQGRRYAHIKLAPGQKIPFSTLTFRVMDARVLADIPTGALVEFRAQRIDGENVLVEIRPVRP